MTCGKIEEKTTILYWNRELLVIFNNKLQIQEVHNITKSHAPSPIVNKSDAMFHGDCVATEAIMA
jgi:hypothetical protein